MVDHECSTCSCHCTTPFCWRSTSRRDDGKGAAKLRRGVVVELAPPAIPRTNLRAQSTLYISLSLSKPLASRIGARTLRNLDGGLGKMNSNSGKELRTNARCRTPFSNSLHADHNRSTTGLYSPRDTPTTHSTPYFTGTGAPAPLRARTRSDAHSPRTRRCRAQCGASTASTSARPTRITPRLPPPDHLYDHGSDRAHDHLRARTHAQLNHAMSARTHALGSHWRAQRPVHTTPRAHTHQLAARARTHAHGDHAGFTLTVSKLRPGIKEWLFLYIFQSKGNYGVN